MIGRELKDLSGKTLAATTKTPLAFDMEQRIVHYFDGSLLMWHEMDDVLFGHITKTSENFVERTVHRRFGGGERGSCSLVLGFTGLDRGAGWASRSSAGARSADLDSRSSVDLDAALAGGSRRRTTDKRKLK